MIQFCKPFSRLNASIFGHQARVKGKDPPGQKGTRLLSPWEEAAGAQALHPLLIFPSEFLEAEFILTGDRGTWHQVAQTFLGYSYGVVDIPGSQLLHMSPPR